MLAYIIEEDGLKWRFLDLLQALLKETMELFYWIIASISSRTESMSC